MEWLTNLIGLVIVLVAAIVLLHDLFAKRGTSNDLSSGASKSAGNDDILTIASGMDTSLFAPDWESGGKFGGVKFGQE